MSLNEKFANIHELLLSLSPSIVSQLKRIKNLDKAQYKLIHGIKWTDEEDYSFYDFVFKIVQVLNFFPDLKKSLQLSTLW